ncbi:MAG: YbbR-like domain-containing protein [Candidatus Marinimicrobia bacterium]|nr:YbbR-like domain-containing protein [Candidatus Neomarinimicrobiota bacterium]
MKFSDIIESVTSRKIGLRLGAFGLAIILWFFIVSSEMYVMVLTVPIEVRNLSEQKALREEVPELAQVRFEGTGRALFKTILLNRFYKDFKLVLDLDRISDEYEFVLNDYFRLYPQKIVIPNEFEIRYIEVDSPREIKISLDDYSVRTIPTVSKIVIEPASGFIIVGDVKQEPIEIEIAGPNDIVENITSISTLVDTIIDVNTNMSQYFVLDLPHQQIQLSQTDVRLSVDVQALSEKIISEVPVSVINVPAGYRVFVSPHTVSLTIIGGIHFIENITPEDIQLTIDFNSQWNLDRQFYEPQIEVPNGVIDWQDLSPPKVELIVTQGNN